MTDSSTISAKGPSNPFFDTDSAPQQPPGSYYAYLDQVEQYQADEEGAATLLFDCIGSSWIDSHEDETDGWESLETAPLAIIQVDLPDLHAYRKESPHEIGNWYQLYFSDFGDLQAVRYTTLSGPGNEGGISELQQLDDRSRARLEKFFSLNGVPELSRREAERLFSHLGKIDYICVMDVGQGNANALYRDGDGALLYFDAGGGVAQHAKTYPPSLRFCTTRSPPVVLSHWDWDHWASAVMQPHTPLLESIWVAPNQGSLSGVHAAFALSLHQRHNLRLWPKSLPEYQFGKVTIQKCTGSGADKNNSGLAMIVAGPDSAHDPVLLTGDADYHHIPAAGPAGEFHAVVAPHHGGKAHTSHPVAQPNSAASGRLVYSYGAPNHYGHPHFATLHAHRTQGWKGLMTRHTVTPSGLRRQHIGIAWDDSSHTSGCGHCDPIQW